MLDVRDLCVHYGAAPALTNVSLAIGDGELVSLVGPNGAGKTTLVNALAGLHRPTSGTMTMDGRGLMRLAPHRFCDCGIALVPEGRRLFTRMSVLTYVGSAALQLRKRKLGKAAIPGPGKR